MEESEDSILSCKYRQRSVVKQIFFKYPHFFASFQFLTFPNTAQAVKAICPTSSLSCIAHYTSSHCCSSSNESNVSEVSDVQYEHSGTLELLCSSERGNLSEMLLLFGLTC